MLREDPAGGNPLAMPCPRCGCRGNYVAHGSYLRHVVHRGREERVVVRRVRCASCMSTHALIPPGVVPYRQFSEGLVLAVLAAWAAGTSNAEVRRAFGVSETTRRRMVSGARRRACALLACGASRAAVDAALASPPDAPEPLPTSVPRPPRRMSVRQAVFAPSETVPTREAVGRVCAAPTVACPPAIPVAVSGELITPEIASALLQNGIEHIRAVRE